MYSFKQIIVKAREKNNKTQPKPWTNTYTLQLVTLYKEVCHTILYFILRRRSDNGGWVGVITWTRANTSVTLVRVNLVAYARHLSICLRPTQRVGGFVVLPDPAWGCPQHTAAAPGGRPPAAESWTSNTLMTHLLNQMYMRTILKQCDCMISIQYTGLCPMFSPSSGWSIISWDIFNLSYLKISRSYSEGHKGY